MDDSFDAKKIAALESSNRKMREAMEELNAFVRHIESGHFKDEWHGECGCNLKERANRVLIQSLEALPPGDDK